MHRFHYSHGFRMIYIYSWNQLFLFAKKWQPRYGCRKSLDVLKTTDIFLVPSRVSFSGRQPAPGKMQTSRCCVCAMPGLRRVYVWLLSMLVPAGGVRMCERRRGVFFGAQNIHSAWVPEARVNIFPATIFNSTPFENSLSSLFERWSVGVYFKQVFSQSKQALLRHPHA